MEKITLYGTHTEEFQQQILRQLIDSAKETEYGRKYGFSSIRNYEDFAIAVPLVTYEKIKSDIDRMRHGERDILWHGQVKWYAKSSGTTNDKSKFIPVSQEGLVDLHYRGSTDVVALYLAEHPQSKVFDGKALILGGSHAPNYNIENALVGDLSAILIENMNPFMHFFVAPSKATALLSDFEIKREKMATELIRKNITSLSGVPSWMLSILLRVLKESGCEKVDDIWPNMEVFFHGGISFAPYRSQYEKLIRRKDMVYMETYNASEGFFGVQSSQSEPSLLLMIDNGVFYEFCPIENINEDGEIDDISQVVPLHKVELHKDYAMLITTNCGLWRYIVGDTLRFTSQHPYKFIITGRIKSFINAFGEELIVDNAEKGLAMACKLTKAEIVDYTAAPVFMDEEGKCRHQWLIEFSREPASLEEFAKILDHQLQQINSDYEAKRFKDITLQPLEIVVARRNLFTDWLRQRGKLGGQHKIPRLSNNRNIIDKLLQME